MLKRITKREARKLFAGGTSIIILCPHKMIPNGPFSMGCRISGKEYLDKAEEYRSRPDLLMWKGNLLDTAWDLMYNNWSFYNSSYETGYYPAYYVEK